MEYEKWIEHDGRGCPLPSGVKVLVRQRSGDVVEYITGRMLPWRGSEVLVPMERATGKMTGGVGVNPWKWAFLPPLSVDVMAYKVPRPQALETLRQLAADPPSIPGELVPANADKAPAGLS